MRSSTVMQTARSIPRVSCQGRQIGRTARQINALQQRQSICRRTAPRPLHVCCSGDRASTPNADQGFSTGTAVLEQSEQFKFHIKAAMQDQSKYRGGQMPQELAKLVEKMEAIPREQRKPISVDSIKGVFTEGLNTTNNLDQDGTTTLGTLSFQQFKPADLKVKVYDTVLLQGVDAPNQYLVEIPFEVIEGPLKGLKGMQSTIGEWEVAQDLHARQNVYFTALQIKPQASDPEGIKQWNDAMREGNPSMDDNGVVRIDFPKRMSAWRDFLFHDDEIHVTKGNRGSTVIVLKQH
ncbi:hypothetical protein WJX72_011097 [[Myrmecia] bisecta]|uniref:Plastid lipid-associated protein/fibrillin conserved domain-containing protein n=1 Tax=[Myrmecia] bisecta TaxID=41462 RepID=A0AAW1PX99_9CHLO